VLCLIYISYLVLALVFREIGTSSQLSRFHLKTVTESSLRNVVCFINKNRTMDKVQKHHNFVITLLTIRHTASALILVSELVCE
jgi:hypothetical protein